MTNHARAGRAFEHEVRNRLREDGYTVVRSAGSKTPADLVAIKRGQVLFVQAKRHGRESRTERLALLRLVNCLPTVADAIVADRDGPRGDALRMWRLTGKAPADRVPFTTDEIEGAA